MLFCVVGLSFKTSSIEIREKLTFNDKDIPNALELLSSKEEISECLILSTCNRIELYALMKEPRPAILREFLRDFHKYAGKIESVLYTKTGLDAIVHICNVASGLDSLVFGEPQILGQVKDAFNVAVQNKTIHYGLEYLFSQVFSIAKKVRTKTHIGEKNTSISYTFIQLAKAYFSDLANKSVLIMGAGDMGELTIRNLLSQNVKSIIIANRTFQKAVELANNYGGVAIMLHEIFEYIDKVDIIINSIPSPQYILTQDKINEIIQKYENKALFIVDLSVPRSIDPEISQIEKVKLYNIDDLKQLIEMNLEDRQKEADRAFEIINTKAQKIHNYIDSIDIIPVLRAIRSKAEEIRIEGINSTLKQSDFNEMHKERIDCLTRSIVNQILNHSEIKLREYSTSFSTRMRIDSLKLW